MKAQWSELGVDLRDSGRDDRSAASDPGVATQIRSAPAVLLAGGSWHRPVTELAGTACLRALVAMSDSGGTVVTYSAGTEAMGQWFVTDRLSGDEEEVLPALGWLRDTAVVAHYPTYGADQRLTRVLTTSGCRRGIGVAHGGALLSPGGGWSDFEDLAPGMGHLVTTQENSRTSPG